MYTLPWCYLLPFGYIIKIEMDFAVTHHCLCRIWLLVGYYTSPSSGRQRLCSGRGEYLEVGYVTHSLREKEEQQYYSVNGYMEV